MYANLSITPKKEVIHPCNLLVQNYGTIQNNSRHYSFEHKLENFVLP